MPGFLSSVLSDRVRMGIAAGLVAAAGTAGALAGFGLRHGAPTEAFAAIGRLVLGVAPTEGTPRQLAAIAAGLLLHVVTVVVWGVLFALFAGRLRGTRLLAAAALFGAATYAINVVAVPALLRLGYGVRALPPQLVLLYTVLALSLAVGIRLAPLGKRTG